MEQMPFNVNHDILIMSILNLKDVAQKRVASHRLQEVHLGCLVASLVLMGLWETWWLLAALLADAELLRPRGDEIAEGQLEILT